MKPESTVRWSTRLTGVALLGFTLLATGCGRPPDEAWLRVLHFEKDSVVVSSVSSIVQKTTTVTESATTSTTTTLGTTDYVTVVFANQSTVAGTRFKDGDGVTVDQVRITYAMAGYSPPAASYTVTVYVPASDTNTKLEIALVSTALKSWLADTIPKSALENGLNASARVMFHARSDSGSELETEAGIGIVFSSTSE